MYCKGGRPRLWWVKKEGLGLGEINMWCGVGEGGVICKINRFKKWNKMNIIRMLNKLILKWLFWVKDFVKIYLFISEDLVFFYDFLKWSFIFLNFILLKRENYLLRRCWIKSDIF